MEIGVGDVDQLWMEIGGGVLFWMEIGGTTGGTRLRCVP